MVSACYLLEFTIRSNWILLLLHHRFLVMSFSRHTAVVRVQLLIQHDLHRTTIFGDPNGPFLPATGTENALVESLVGWVRARGVDGVFDCVVAVQARRSALVNHSRRAMHNRE